MKTVLMAFCWMLYINSALNTLAQTNDEVAIVNGIKILAPELSVEEGGARLLYKLKYGRQPSTDDAAGFTEFKKQLEQDQFLGRVHHIIWEKKKSEFGITATDAEAQAKWTEFTNSVDMRRALLQARDVLEPLLAALNAVYDNGEDKDQVFDRGLKDRMKKTEWEFQLNYYNTPAKRKILETALARPTEDPQTWKLGMKSMVITDKIDARIDSEIAKTDPRFAEYKQLSATDPKNDKLKKYPPNYLSARRAEWWAEQYKVADVQIRNPALREVWLDSLRTAPALTPRGGAPDHQ